MVSGRVVPVLPRPPDKIKGRDTYDSSRGVFVNLVPKAFEFNDHVAMRDAITLRLRSKYGARIAAWHVVKLQGHKRSEFPMRDSDAAFL